MKVLIGNGEEEFILSNLQIFCEKKGISIKYAAW